MVAQGKGSKGLFDLMAARVDEVHLIEVKATKTPFAGFPPARRQELQAAAWKAGAKPILAWWPADRKGLRLIPSSDWPK